MTDHDDDRLSHLSQQGYQYLRENMTVEARECFESILSEEPENNYALVGLGDLARKEKRFDRAAQFYQRCLEVHPENNYALFGLAESYRAMRQFNRAIEIWERYLKHDNENVTVLTRVADVYRKVRNFDRSRDLYDRVLAIEPDNPYALIGLGHLNYDFKDYESARTFWKRMYEIRGEAVDIRVLTSLGNCHRKLKSYADGIPYFRQALEREPNNFYALYGLADCHRGLQNWKESLDYWLRILDLDPQNKVILTRTGDSYRAMGKFDQAEEYYRRALHVQYDMYAILGLAIIHRAKGRFTDAVAALEDLASSEPENARVFLELAGCYEDQQRLPEALAILSRHLRNTRNPSKAVQRKVAELQSKT